MNIIDHGNLKPRFYRRSSVRNTREGKGETTIQKSENLYIKGQNPIRGRISEGNMEMERMKIGMEPTIYLSNDEKNVDEILQVFTCKMMIMMHYLQLYQRYPHFV